MRGGAVLRAGVAQASLGFSLTGLGAVLVLLARDLGVPVGRLASLPAWFGAGLLLVAVLGPVLLRPGPGPALRAGCATLAAGAALLAAAPGLGLASAGAVLLGLGGAAIVLVTPALLTGPRMAADLTRANAAASVAAVLAPALVGLVDATGLVGGRWAMALVVPPLLLVAASPAPAVAAPPAAAGAPGRPAARQAGLRWSRMVLSVAVEFCFTVWAVARLYDTGLSAPAAAALGAAFPIGMALGRLAGPVLVRVPGLVRWCAATTATGALGVVAVDHPAVVTAALALAGAGVAPLYPVTLADLVATPGLRGAHAASLGALASGVAIVSAPAGLALLADTTGLRAAFLVTLPLLLVLVLLRPSRPAPPATGPVPAGRTAGR
ncbi:hypothetical protein [Spirilliplanes yamanashiensis]|uniref:MFS transporter n=1 Tax=Spirilliplanes yamanashiensis TaxID=42233 RepID=A0A8J3YAV2_9ACTN|nr:hypothetical protein [Spirilliplanes yamanashiensis]MDP9818817.1 MFS family permease [Spirilliplanes yamanashiensis]GIJ05271.1 hypothetical protein Sya03_46230 [Spirilliplanes yamanashiensis]